MTARFLTKQNQEDVRVAKKVDWYYVRKG